KNNFIHEYSISPTTFSYQLPNKNSNLDDITIAPNPLSYLFDNTGTETSYSNQLFINKLNLDVKNRKITSVRPRNLKLTSKSFIDDSLYNPNYGYFNNNDVEIFHLDKPFDYAELKDIDEFLDTWEKKYDKYSSTNRNNLQLWHTPTELFQPYYGEAIARYLLVNYKLSYYPYHDLIIYEMGGGNGTLMLNILDYIKRVDPEVYERTQYKIIEISSKLANKQRSQFVEQLLKLKSFNEHNSKIQIINKSIFDWDKRVGDPCYFLALEVFDNFAHDIIRYNNLTGQPYQGYVVTDENGDFHEYFNPELDYYCDLFLRLRENGEYPQINKKKRSFKNSLRPAHPLDEFKFKKLFMNQVFPFRNQLSYCSEFIPTRLLEFFFILKNFFPNHSLLSSDFNYLPNSIPSSYNGPVKRSYHDQVITANTYMVNQGYFDIMFPTDFPLISDLYRQINGKVGKIESHEEFLTRWSDLERTTTKTGENPMTEFYKNVSFF
ncbi:type II protein arginine methyltransferase, partial [Ascoidea rubescens DSM 1968]